MAANQFAQSPSLTLQTATCQAKRWRMLFRCFRGIFEKKVKLDVQLTVHTRAHFRPNMFKVTKISFKKPSAACRYEWIFKLYFIILAELYTNNVQSFYQMIIVSVAKEERQKEEKQEHLLKMEIDNLMYELSCLSAWSRK